MSENWFELAVIAFIVCGIGAAIWKGGQANPINTGTLGKQVARLEKKIAGIDSKVGQIESQVKAVERRSATASDIERLERLIAEQGRHLDEHAIRQAEQGEVLARIAEAGEQRGRQLDRLYDFIVERGMSK